VGLILDLAVAALAVAVVASLALLAWTLAVSGVRGIHEGRRRIARLRTQVTDAGARLARTGEPQDR
jgi:VIT1/CCC1 family predicted Fe2+/Mn2+ transporter